jgi:flagellar biosynthesis/type III secretory pathway M-ring protein FliF/YscJ
MSVALAVVVAVVLLSILFVLFIIFIGVREPRAARKQREAGDRVRAGEAEGQHDRSVRRQADVRATHAERADADE